MRNNYYLYAAKISAALLLLIFVGTTHALNFTTLPPYLTETRGSPQVMINLSRDHQLFYKAYNEFSDLDGDGQPETTYLHSYSYYGYFDSQRCYLYDAANVRFNPSRKVNASDRYCGNSNEWSGNFLNWATMTRMDVVRRILYGGYRVVDNGPADSDSNITVLERAPLPTDAHSFAKYYGGTDIAKLTPFTVNELTFCNRTPGASDGSARYSHTNTNAPEIIIAEGNHALWNSNERWQCNWAEERGASNGNDPRVSGLNASSSNPSRNSKGLGTPSGGKKGTYIARVSVCDQSLSSDFTDDEKTRCKQYPSGNYKPTGLLHKYGERNEAAFGLLTGTWGKNISGGVVRKNVGTFTDEVSISTDGKFTSVKGLVYNINKIRIYGYDYNDGSYSGVDNCSYQLIGLVEGDCASWGNPIGEMLLEAIRYFAGKTPTAAFVPSPNDKDSAIGLTIASWEDPFRDSTTSLYGQKICRQVNVVNFNASVTSYDGDQWSSAATLPFPSGTSVDSLTNNIGTSEGIYSTAAKWFVGDNGSGTKDSLCTGKTISSLAGVQGICPEAPAYRGSYRMAGAALFSHINPIRTDIPIPTNNKRAFRINNYSVALATGTPRIQIPVPGSAGKFFIIQPAYRLSLGSGGAGTLVDFKTIQQTPSYGKYLIQWEDSEQGGDYDMDVWGTLEYQVVGQKIRISTYVGYDATVNPQGFGYVVSGAGPKDGVHFHSGILGFNFEDPTNISISPADNVNASGGCKNCYSKQAKTTAEYDLVGVADGVLRDPLWYSAKYGGFDRSVVNYSYTPGDALPTRAWDVKKTDGSRGSDGVPDNYFYAINPAELERSLADIFSTILKAGGSAPAAATSSQTTATNAVYVSTYSINPASSVADADASGQIFRYGISAGTLTTSALWEAGSKLTAQNWDTGRIILTSGSAGATAFRWDNLDASQKEALNRDAYGTTDALGSRRLEWLRGSSANETAAAASTGFRQRPTTKLGAVINSTPWLIGRPNAGYSAAEYGGGYLDFRTANASRNTLFVGANDGMLHAIDATTGNEQFAYVPRSVYPRLSALAAKDFSLNSSTNYATVDGSVMVADVKPTTSGNWRSYLFGVLGRGGQGIFALDVTAPSTAAENAAASIVKWEFTDAQDADLGNIVGRTLMRSNNEPAQVGYLANGRWGAIFGNGYNSDLNDGSAGTGKAVLFVFFANGPTGANRTWVRGTDYIKIDTGALGAGPNNGLSTPTPVDLDNDGKIDYVYAGDLKGNVWKFDLRDPSPANWRAALSSRPLYSAKTAGGTVQPITTAVYPIPHPQGGYQIFFGTGKSLEAVDYPMATPVTQSIYALWDRPGNNAELPAGRSRLVKQQFTDVDNLRTTVNINVAYSSKDGWYADLPQSSEMTIFNPSLLALDQVVVRSIFPESTTDGCRVESGAYTMVFNPITGNGVKRSIDINMDGFFNAADDPLPGKTLAPGATTTGFRDKNQFEFTRSSVDNSTAGGDPTRDPLCNNQLLTTSGDGTVKAMKIAGRCLAGRLGWREVTRNR